MKRSILTCLGLLAATIGIEGWGRSSSPSVASPQLDASHFPLNDQQQWFVTETYLILKPYQDDNDYASRLVTKGSLGTTISMKMKLEKPDYDWYSGVRLGVGRYLPHHDKWDITFYTTYYYAQEQNSCSPRRNHNTLLTPLWSPTFDGGATKGHLAWRLNFFNWDFSIGREYALLRTIVAHPFIGLRAALIYKSYEAKYSDQFTDGNISRKLNDRFKASDNFWGIGPRAGVDLQFYFKEAWSFLGGLSGALFYGRYDVKETFSTHLTNAGNLNSKRYKSSDERYCVRANLDAALGIGWETWFKQHSVRFAPSILFEGSCWFDTNQLFLPKSSTTPTNSSIPNFSNYRKQGNLILMGLSFNFQTDF